jgi:hypothetical protein
MKGLPMKLAAKLSQIMGTVDRIPKNGRNDFHGYYYATEADVAEHVRKLLTEKNIIMISDMKECEQFGEITRVKIRFTFYDGDSDETISFCVFGDGHDKLDKGVYKAFTGAEKYALMKTFLIPTGDDPEGDSGRKGPSQKQPARPKPTQPQTGKGKSTKPLSDAQKGKIFAEGGQLGWTDDQTKDKIAEMYDGRSIKDLSVAEASAFIKYLMEENERMAGLPPDYPPPGDDEIPF